MNQNRDCIIVGGGAAGLSAALVLGRARKETLIVDAGRQSNLPAPGIGGLLGHDGTPPAELYAAGREELSKYPSVEFRSGSVETGSRDEGVFSLVLDDGTVEKARRVILATGMEYRYDDLPGIKQLWGGSVFHCPFCHGWEVRDGGLAVRGNGDRGVHGALILRGWSADIVVLTDGPAEFSPEQQTKLDSAGIKVDERPLAGLVAQEGKLTAIEFSDGSLLERDGLLTPPRLHQRTSLSKSLGVAAAEPGPMAEDAVAFDNFQQTSVPGIFVAGDLTAVLPQVANAIASGSTAAAMVVMTLQAEDFGLTLPPGLATGS